MLGNEIILFFSLAVDGIGYYIPFSVCLENCFGKCIVIMSLTKLDTEHLQVRFFWNGGNGERSSKPYLRNQEMRYR